MDIYQQQDLPHTPYFYIIQNINSGMFYAGCRFSKSKTAFSNNGCHPIELLKSNGYHTSSNTVKNVIEKEGLESFVIIQIIEEYKLDTSILEYETWFLQENRIAENGIWYNIHDNSGNFLNGEHMKRVIFEKYGVEYTSQIPEVKHKIKMTMLEKYGIECAYQIPEVVAKSKATILERYNVEYPFQNKEINDAAHKTILEKYGVNCAMQNPEIAKKSKATILEKYGVENVMQNQEIVNKVHATILERYGVEHAMQNKEVMEKVKAANLEKYGTEHYFSSDQYKEKRIGSHWYNDGNKNYNVHKDKQPEPHWVKGMKSRTKSI